MYRIVLSVVGGPGAGNERRPDAAAAAVADTYPEDVSVGILFTSE